MLQKNQFCIIIVITLLFLSSCASVSNNSYYIPSEPNSLLLAKKNDLKVSVSSNTIPYLYESSNESVKEIFLNTQLGYSPINHLGIFVNYFKWNSIRPSYNEFITGIESSSASMALGGYYLFQSVKQKRRMSRYNTAPLGFLIDAYAGYGRGKIDNYYFDRDNLLLKYNKPYFQLGYHWQDEFVGVSWVYRIGQINYSEGVYNVNLSQDQQGSFPYLKIQENTNFSFRESSFKVFTGIKAIRVYFGFTIAKVNSPDPTFKLSHGSDMVYTGLTISIDEFYNKFLKNKKQ